MKDSGIEWIGNIPANWYLKRMKTCIKSRDGGAWGETPTGDDGDIICLRIADFDYQKFKFKDCDISELTKRHYNKSVIDKLLLKKNDILIEKSGGGEKTPVGRTVIFDKSYHALFANFMDRLTCNSNVVPKFMQYIFVTFYKNEYTKNYIKQTTGIQNLDLTSMISKEFIALPPITEQQRIANYLDSKCTEIDAILENTRVSIEEYKKLKQAVIMRAVTKGIRGDRPMKDSGIEWIEEIPKNWGKNTIFQLCTQVKNKNVGLIENNLLSLSYGKIKRKSINTVEGLLPESFDGYNIIEKDDIVLRLTDLQNDHTSLRVGISEERGIITSAYLTIRNRGDFFPKYLYYYLYSFDISKGFYGMGAGVRQSLNWDGLKCLKVITPSREEQEQIATFLDIECAEIDDLISKKEQYIKEIENYKKSLIYEYVTGKKEVHYSDNSFKCI